MKGGRGKEGVGFGRTDSEEKKKNTENDSRRELQANQVQDGGGVGWGAVKSRKG